MGQFLACTSSNNPNTVTSLAPPTGGVGRLVYGVNQRLHRRPVVRIAPQVAGLVGCGPRRGFGVVAAASAAPRPR